MAIIAAVFAFLQFTTFGMVVRAGMADRETVGLLGIDIDRRFTHHVRQSLPAVAGPCRGDVYAPINAPNYHMGMDFLVISASLWSLSAAWARFRVPCWPGFLSWVFSRAFASMSQVIDLIPGINQIIIYLVAIIVILLTRPQGA